MREKNFAARKLPNQTIGNAGILFLTMSSTKSKSVRKSALKNVAQALATNKRSQIKEAPSVVEKKEDEIDAETDESEGSEDDGGIDDEGIERLMKALGDDGLDEFEQAQLEAALGDPEDESEEEDGEDANTEEENSDQDEEVEIHDTEGEEEDEQFIQLEDVEAIVDDAVPFQKVEINNEIALARIRESLQLDPSIPWTETLAVSYPHTIDVDVNDDLNRELALYVHRQSNSSTYTNITSFKLQTSST